MGPTLSIWRPPETTGTYQSTNDWTPRRGGGNMVILAQLQVDKNKQQWSGSRANHMGLNLVQANGKMVGSWDHDDLSDNVVVDSNYIHICIAWFAKNKKHTLSNKYFLI